MKTFTLLLALLSFTTYFSFAETFEDINAGKPATGQEVPAYSGDEATEEELEEFQRQEEQEIEREMHDEISEQEKRQLERELADPEYIP